MIPRVFPWPFPSASRSHRCRRPLGDGQLPSLAAIRENGRSCTNSPTTRSLTDPSSKKCIKTRPTCSATPRLLVRQSSWSPL